MQTYLKTGTEYTVQLVSNLLIAILLGIGVAHGASAPNKPYKVCPTPPEDKDFPCVVQEASAIMAIRGAAPPSPVYMVVTKDTEKEELKKSLEMKESEIKALKEEIKLLEEMLRDLMDKEIAKGADVTTPSQK